MLKLNIMSDENENNNNTEDDTKSHSSEDTEALDKLEAPEDTEEQSEPESEYELAPVKTSSSFRLKANHVVLFIAVSAVLFLVYLGIGAIRRKFMSADERIREVRKYCKINEDMFARLGNYKDTEYTEKFIEYLNFLVNTTPLVREDLRVIYRDKPAHKFKTRNLLLTGGRNQKQYRSNIKKKLYLIGDYIKYLEEAENVLSSKNSYKKLPHKYLGKPYKISAISYSGSNRLKEAKKKYSMAKAKYGSYSNRLKEKIKTMKLLKAEYVKWKMNRKNRKASGQVKEGECAEDDPECAKEEKKKKNKEIIKKDGLTDREILQLFKETRNRLKLEIPELRNLKQNSYQKYKVQKLRYEKAKKGLKGSE